MISSSNSHYRKLNRRIKRPKVLAQINKNLNHAEKSKVPRIIEKLYLDTELLGRNEIKETCRRKRNRGGETHSISLSMCFNDDEITKLKIDGREGGREIEEEEEKSDLVWTYVGEQLWAHKILFFQFLRRRMRENLFFFFLGKFVFHKRSFLYRIITLLPLSRFLCFSSWRSMIFWLLYILFTLLPPLTIYIDFFPFFLGNPWIMNWLMIYGFPPFLWDSNMPSFIFLFGQVFFLKN